jgi:hypothetical protein
MVDPERYPHLDEDEDDDGLDEDESLLAEIVDFFSPLIWFAAVLLFVAGFALLPRLYAHLMEWINTLTIVTHLPL